MFLNKDIYSYFRNTHLILMKFSIFNSTIHLDGKHTLLFNSFSKKFIAIKNEIFDFGAQNVDDIEKYNIKLFTQLCDGGFIVESSIEEPSRLRQSIINSENNTHEYILHINPTLDCNFSCWYCYENHIHLSRMTRDVLVSIKGYIRGILIKPEIESFELGFFGGEPLLYFTSVAKVLIAHTSELCKKHGKEFSVHFTSNGALLHDEIIRFLSQYNCGFQITLDGGRIFHDTTRYFKNNKGSFDLILRNIIKLARAKIYVIVRVNYTDVNIKSVETILDEFNKEPNSIKEYLKFDFQRVWQNKSHNFDDTERNIAYIRQKFRDHKFQVLSNYIPHDAMSPCYSDKLNHTLINYNGDVYGCTARDFTTDNRIGVLQPNGEIKYAYNKIERRNRAKLSKEICTTCRIAPLCGGGCKQKALEGLGFEGCTMGYTELEKDRIILEIFEHSFNL